MRHNGQSALPTSALPPNLISLYPGERPRVACPECGRWRLLHRGMLVPHRSDDGVSRCPGSAQRVVIDLNFPEWQERLSAAERDTVRRRGSRVRPQAAPPVAHPVFQPAS